MNESTEGVVLQAGFIFDLLASYDTSRETFSAPLFEMAVDLDPNQPTAMVPISLYNEMCTWIENNLGSSNLRRAGELIGKRAYEQMVSNPSMSSTPGPLEMMKQLAQVASDMIQDPLGRGWEILEEGPDNIVMRRTQSFNCILQEGLLQSLIQRCEVTLVSVRHLTCVRDGAEFCDFGVTWFAKGQS
jgi:predicted hydrocarbon binding protein